MAAMRHAGRLTEREGEGLRAGVEEGDLERALGDRAALADELIQPRLGDRARAVGVAAPRVVAPGRPPGDPYADPHRPPGCRAHDKVHTRGGEAAGDPPAGFFR